MKTFSIAGLCLWLLLCMNTASEAQVENLRFERLTIEDGLSNNSIWNLLQDHRGYVWFGTRNGLNKFDGYTVTTYKREPRDSASLLSNGIGAMLVDREGNLWIGFDGNGICQYDYHTEKFICYQHPTQQYTGALSLNEDQEGSLWLGSLDGLYRFDKSTGTFSAENFAPLLVPEADSSLDHNFINVIYKDKKETLWIGSHYGLHQMHLQPGGKDQPSQVSFTHYHHDPARPNSLSNNVVHDILEDHMGVLWVSTDDGLNAFNPATDSFSHYTIQSTGSKAGDLAEDPQGHLWIAADSGLVRLNKERTERVEVKHSPENPYSIDKDHIVSLMADQSGTIWVGTLSHGINKANIYQKPFQLYQHHPSLSHSLSLNQVVSITEDQTGTVWIGTLGGGLNRFDKQKQTFTHYRHDPEDPRSLSDDYVSDILEDQEGNLWIATMGGHKTFSRLNPNTGTFESYSEGVYGKLGEHGVFTIYEDKEGVLWLGTMWGVKSWDRNTGKIMHYTHDPNKPDGLSDHWITSIIEDHQGNLWMGADVGLNKLDRKTGRFTQYKTDSHNDSITANEIRCVFQDSQKNLWIGTKGGGLCRFDYVTESFEAFTLKQGLPDNTVYSILEDEAGNLWLGTNNGLSCFSPTRQTFTNYDASDGLQSNQFSISYGIGAHAKGRDGTLYFGGINGFNAFDPAKIQPNPYVPPVVITQFKLFDKLIPGNHEAKEIHLAYEENFFSFEFAALNFMNAQKNQYAYRLQNFDSDWVDSGTRRYASYTNLDPGRYVFQVKASNNDGLWNEQGTSMILVIHPPWWQTWWAYGLYALLGISILYGLVYYLVSRERLKNDLKLQRLESEKMHEIDQMKSHFFANISHEFRTPLTLILGPLQNFLAHSSAESQEKPVYQMMLRHAQRLLHLINQLLDLSKLEAGNLSLETKPGNLIAFLKGLMLSFTSLAERKHLQYHMQYPTEHPVVYFDADKLEKIIVNLLSNAFKFTPEAGSITVSVRLLPTDHSALPESVRKAGAAAKLLELKVQDSGQGIAQEEQEKIFDRFYQVEASRTREQEGTGIGLSLVKELVALHGGEITLESQEEKGSTFTVRLPLLLADYEQISVGEPVRENGQPAFSALEMAKHAMQESSPAVSEQPSTEAPLVLIVEDNADVRAFIRQTLQPAYQTIEAVNGLAGYQKALETIPDLILSDVMMPSMEIPRMDGIELSQRLKADEKTAHIPVILLTAKASGSDKIEGLQTGADDYILKPFEAEELLVRIHNLIESRKKLRAHYSRQITLQPKAITITSVDEQFLQKVMLVIEAHMDDTAFGVEALGREVGMSRMQLFRKLKALTDYAPGDFIRVRRLHRAAELLRQGAGNIAEVAFLVGFQDPSYFTKCFQKQFNQTPSDYIARTFSS